MQIRLFFLLVLLSSILQAQPTVTICNGDSTLLYNNWETQNGIYTDGITSTTLIVNPTPTLTGSFVLNGNAAQPIPNTYRLTQAINWQSGSAWNSVTLNLTQPFTFDVDMFFGSNDAGADGIAFLLQQVSTSVGTGGGGIGYEGISPSFGVEFDTWHNSQYSDPTYDHLAVQRNGDLNHIGVNNLVPFTGFPPGNINIEDGLWHNVVFSWDPSTFNFRVEFDGTLLINYNNNIVANIFGSSPYVYWGFTAATGGANNLQQFRVNSLGIQLAPNITICQDDTVQINPQINTPLYTYLWSPNYNIINNTTSTTFFFPDTTTVYSLEVTNSYGCSVTDSIEIFVNLPTSNITILTECDSYTWGVNSQTYTTSGIYTDISANAAGCTHIDSLDITINHYLDTTLYITTCDPYHWDDNIYPLVLYTSSGVYIDTIINAFGCDSIVTLNLTIATELDSIVHITACDSYSWNGITYTASGVYTDTILNNAGCETFTHLYLTINNPDIFATQDTICSGDSITLDLLADSLFGQYDTIIFDQFQMQATSLFNYSTPVTSQGVLYAIKVSGVFNISDVKYYDGAYLFADTNSNVITPNFIVRWNFNGSSQLQNPLIPIPSTYNIEHEYWYYFVGDGSTMDFEFLDWPYTDNGGYLEFSIFELIENNHNYLWNTGDTTSAITINPIQTTTYYVIQTTNGVSCTDSIIVPVLDTSLTIMNINTCNSFVWNGTTYTQSGTDTYITTNSNSCDSTVILNLTIDNSVTTTDSVTICYGDNIVVGSSIYDTIGIYIDTLTTSNGCDSIINTVVDIIEIDITQNDTAICFGDSISLGVVPNAFEWQLYYLENFQNTIGNEWNYNNTISFNSTKILGALTNDTVQLALFNLPYHDSLKIIFDLYIFDSWDGNSQSPVFTPADYWGLNVNAAPVIHTTFANNSQMQSYPSDFPNFNPAETGAFSNTLPILYFTGSWPSGNSSLYKINKALVNNSTSAIVNFYAHNLNFGLQDESWGINNVQVYLYSNNFTNNTIWSTGDTTASITVNPSQTTTYYVTQTENGVSCTDSVTVTVLDTSLTVMNITTCDTYTWAVNGATYIASGTYTDVSTNAAGCTHTEVLDLVIVYSDEIDLVIDETHISCFNENDGSAIITPTGGIYPYTYLWSDGQITNPAISFAAGLYSCIITDAIGCQVDTFIVINEANEIAVDTFSVKTPICRYDESTLTINISNSLSNTYTILLLDSVLKSFEIDTNGLLIPEGVPITLTPNFSREVYIISLTDNQDCTQDFNKDELIEVKQLPQLAINEENICFGEPSYTLNNAMPSGGTYFINNVMTNYFDVENLEAGDYSIRYEYTDPITTCSNQITKIVTINQSPEPEMHFSPQPTDINNSDILFLDNSNEEVLISEWHLGDGTIIYDESSFWHTYTDTAGTYTIRYYITNIYGCTDSVINQLTINPIYRTYIPSSFTPNNDSDNDYFYPSIIGGNNYNMKIYDRWGGIIYNEDNGKWNGTINNNLIINGVYAYSITVLDFKDKPFIYTGLITIY